MKAKRLRQKIRKENINILTNYIDNIKKMKLNYRLQIAWGIIKGTRWQAEILRFIFVLILSLAIFGAFKIFE